MDPHTALALTQIRSAELQADARRHALVKNLTCRRASRSADRRTFTTHSTAHCTTCAA